MRENVREAVHRVLCRVEQDGLVGTELCWSASTGLKWWQRAINALTKWMGADAPAFTDPKNFCRIYAVPLGSVADPSLIEEAMRDLAPEVRCRVCGSTDLTCDPAGYYCDAVDWRGAPLLCLNKNHRRRDE